MEKVMETSKQQIKPIYFNQHTSERVLGCSSQNVGCVFLKRGWILQRFLQSGIFKRKQMAGINRAKITHGQQFNKHHKKTTTKQTASLKPKPIPSRAKTPVNPCTSLCFPSSLGTILTRRRWLIYLASSTCSTESINSVEVHITC